MARCPHCKQKIRKKSALMVQRGHQLIAWRKANGVINIGSPPKFDWAKEMELYPELFNEPKKVADKYKVSLTTVYRIIKEKNFKYQYRYKSYKGIRNAD